MAAIYCDNNCPWIKGKQTLCREKRDCACTVCGGLRAINLNLYEACVQTCNNNDASQRPTSRDNFLCKHIGAEVLLKGYQLEGFCGGFDVSTTQQGKLEDKRSDLAQAQKDEQKKIIYSLTLCIAAVIVYMFWKK